MDLSEDGLRLRSRMVPRVASDSSHKTEVEYANSSLFFNTRSIGESGDATSWSPRADETKDTLLSSRQYKQFKQMPPNRESHAHSSSNGPNNNGLQLDDQGIAETSFGMLDEDITEETHRLISDDDGDGPSPGASVYTDEVSVFWGFFYCFFGGERGFVYLFFIFVYFLFFLWLFLPLPVYIKKYI